MARARRSRQWSDHLGISMVTPIKSDSREKDRRYHHLSGSVSAPEVVVGVHDKSKRSRREHGSRRREQADISALRDRVRQMQQQQRQQQKQQKQKKKQQQNQQEEQEQEQESTGSSTGKDMAEIDQGIEALEAVAAAAIRTSPQRSSAAEVSASDGSRRAARVASDGSTVERKGSRKWPGLSSSGGKTIASPRSLFRLPSSESRSRARTSFTTSPPPPPPAPSSAQPFGGSTSSGSAEISVSSGSVSSSRSSSERLVDTLPKSGSVRAAAQALGATQVAGVNSRSPPPRGFRSITGKSSQSAGQYENGINSGKGTGDGGGGGGGNSNPRHKARGWWMKSDKEGKPAAIGVRGENAELRAENLELRKEVERLAEAARALKVCIFERALI